MLDILIKPEVHWNIIKHIVTYCKDETKIPAIVHDDMLKKQPLPQIIS